MKPLKHTQSHGADLTPGTEWLCGSSYPHPNQFLAEGKFGRMFPDLGGTVFPPGFLRDLGRNGGPMDAGQVNNPLSSRIPAGFTFLGQFIDHDITFDTTSSLNRRNDPAMTRNFRTPALELDSVYGMGPEAAPYLYERVNGVPTGKLLIGESDADLPRNHQDVALIGDARNDENFFIASLQLAFLKFHNFMVDQLAGHDDVFKEAQQEVRWHYQWIVLHEYLPLIIGQDLVHDIMASGLKFYRPSAVGGHNKHLLNPFIPVEFSVAAFRFGHTQVNRDLKDAAGVVRQVLPDFDAPDRPTFNAGFTRLDADTNIQIAWNQLFKTDAAVDPEFAARLDTKLAPSLVHLPDSIVGVGTEVELRSLAIRNLLRGNSFVLPAGETVARAMGETPLTANELGGDVMALFQSHGLPTETGKTQTPLWFYVLKEAETRGNGQTLGPVGGRIVGEVLMGLLFYDPASYINQEPNWTPTHGSNGDFTMADLLHAAGVA